MAIPYDIKPVEAKLNSFSTKAEKLNYLENYLFGLRKKEAEFVAMDIETLSRLREKTKIDYDKYMNYIDNGGLIYFNSQFNKRTGRYDIDKFDLIFANKHGIKDLNLLLKRLTIENPIRELKGRIKLFESLIEREKALQPQQTETKTEQETSTFINTFDNISPVEIYQHFYAGLVEKGYLTKQELNEYLKAAFELQTIPEKLFKIKDAPNKEKIYVVFYTYYINVAGKPHKKQPQYVGLLGNYFEGFSNDIIKTNWARGYNPKKH